MEAKTLSDGDRYAALELRVRRIEAALAAMPRGTPSAPLPTYDINVVNNPGFENGTRNGWGIFWFAGPTRGTATNVACDIAGARALQVDEASGSSTRLNWNGQVPCATGQQWLIEFTARFKPGSPVGSGLQIAAQFNMGLTAPDSGEGAYFNANGNPQVTLVLPLNNLATRYSTLYTIPAGANTNFFGLELNMTTGTAPSSAWGWQFDEVSVRRKLT